MSPRLACIASDLSWLPELPEDAVRFDDSDAFLLQLADAAFDIYLVHLQQRGVAGADLIRLIRKRGPAAGIVAVAASPRAVLAEALNLGADMVVDETLDGAEWQAVLAALGRRIAKPAAERWRLDAARRVLAAPGGREVPLSEAEWSIMDCLAEARGQAVTRQALARRLWGTSDGCMDNALQASVYRLRRRIEDGASGLAPIQSVSRVGYRFAAPIEREAGAALAAGTAPAEPGNAQAAGLAPSLRHHVTSSGRGPATLVFAHGYGCDQSAWRSVAPAFSADHRTLAYDLAGHGRAAAGSYDPARHAELAGHARDLLEICDEAGLVRPVFVGHSVSAMVGVLAATARPGYFGALVLVAPSPCYLNDGAYRGGFDRADLERLLTELDEDRTRWAGTMAPLIMGRPDRPELGSELAASFCRVDAAVARHFARVTFLSDLRAELPKVTAPTLLLQCRDDPLAPPGVGAFMHAAMPGSELVALQASGHCPHLSAPQETVAALRGFLSRAPAR